MTLDFKDPRPTDWDENKHGTFCYRVVYLDKRTKLGKVAIYPYNITPHNEMQDFASRYAFYTRDAVDEYIVKLAQDNGLEICPTVKWLLD